MEPSAVRKKNKKQRPIAIHGEPSRHDDMLRTHYPKKSPTYLVAFSLKETYDDLVTAQQMICKRSTPEHSPQESTSSITPTGSFKILETELDKLNVNAENIRSTAEYSPQASTNSITPTGSLNVLETGIGKLNITAKNKQSSPEHGPKEHTDSKSTTESLKILKTEIHEPNIIAKNKPSSPENSPYVCTDSMTPTGSFKILKTELDKSNIIAKNKQDHNPLRKNSPDSITPKDSFTVLEPTSERNQILGKKHFKNKPVGIKNNVHSSIYSTDSSTPTSSLEFSSSDYSNTSRITISEKQKVTTNFTALGTNSDEPSSTKCTDVTVNAIKCDVVTQNSIRCEVIPHEQKKVGKPRQNKEEITVYVYDNLDNKSDGVHTGDIYNTGNTDNTVDSGNTGDTDNKGNDEEVNFVSDKINADTNFSQENRKNNKEPESIFKAARKNRVTKKKRSFRRKSNNTVNIRQKKFKCKSSKKKIDSRLEKYYEKRNNSIDAYQIQLDLYSDEVSTVVSRTQVVHKKARVNLLENSDLTTFASDFDVRSLASSLSTAKEPLISFVSDSSQKTLVQEPSTKSNVTVILDMIKMNQDIEVEHVSSLLKLPNVNDVYKSQVVSIPVTVAYDRSTVSGSKNENHLLTSQETSEEIFTLVKFPLNSCEGVLPLTTGTMSENNEPISDNFDNVTIKLSDKTLINMKSSFVQLSSNDFYNARTSSQFSKCLDSYSTLTNDKNTVIDVERTIENSVLNKEAMIFETVINLDRCDETASTSCHTPSSSDLPYFNDIIVANVPNDKHSTYRNQSDNKDKGKEKEINRKTILTKTTNQPTEKISNKMLNLPNQMEIKAMLREREMTQLKCGDEMRNPPNIPPLWERLMSVLEMAVQRLEDNLVEKIMKEIQKSIVKYPEQKPPTPELKTKTEPAATTSDCENLSVQCDLVKSTAIDKIMGKLSEVLKIKEPDTLHKVNLYNDIEVVVSPDTTLALTEKVDQVTISTLTSNSLKFQHRLSWLASVPASFIRENMLVITSVPTFFVFLLCIYGLIQLLMKPW